MFFLSYISYFKFLLYKYIYFTQIVHKIYFVYTQNYLHVGLSHNYVLKCAFVPLHFTVGQGIKLQEERPRISPFIPHAVVCSFFYVEDTRVRRPSLHFKKYSSPPGCFLNSVKALGGFSSKPYVSIPW